MSSFCLPFIGNTIDPLSNQTKILVFADWYLPGYTAGGPIRSIANLVGKRDYDLSIVTSDRDHGSSTAFRDLTFNKWVQGTYDARVIYLDDDHQSSSSDESSVLWK